MSNQMSGNRKQLENWLKTMYNWNLIWKYELMKIASLEDYNSNFGMDKLVNCEKNYLFQYKDKWILDSTSGIEYLTHFLKNKGYNVVGCDTSDITMWSISFQDNIVECLINRDLYQDYILVEFIFITRCGNQVIRSESTRIIEAYKST